MLMPESQIYSSIGHNIDYCIEKIDENRTTINKATMGKNCRVGSRFSGDVVPIYI